MLTTHVGIDTPNQVKGGISFVDYCGRLYGEECKLPLGVTCWSCNQDYAGYTCPLCPDPHAPKDGESDFVTSKQWKIELTEGWTKGTDVDGEESWKLHGWRTKRCKECNTEYGRFKRYAKIWQRLTDWCDLGLSARLTTFTCRSSEMKTKDREMHCQSLWENVKQLYRTRAWKYCEGMIGVGEATSKRDDDTCHPHIHAITLWSKRPNYREIHQGTDGKLIDNIDWMPKKNRPLYMTPAMMRYLKKYFHKDPIQIGGSDERPRYWVTLGLPRRDPARFMHTLHQEQSNVENPQCTNPNLLEREDKE